MSTRTNTPYWEESRQRWRLAVQKDGERKNFYCSTPGRKGKREVQDKADKWLAGDLPRENPTIREMSERWQEEQKELVSTTQYVSIESIGRLYILPAIGKVRVHAVNNEQMLQRILDKAYTNSASGKPLSVKRLSNIRGIITGFMKYLRKCGLTTLHPENLVIPKKAVRGTRSILQPRDLQILFSVTTSTRGKKREEEWYIYAFRFQVVTGLRPGELLGLEWNDIDEVTGLCSIKRSQNVFGEITTGKNINAQRSFILPELAKNALREQKIVLEQNEMQKCRLVFPNPDGEPTREAMYYRHLKRYCTANQLTSVTPYELRHTWYSINKELPKELVKSMGGHSEAMDTFGVYGHEVDGEKSRLADLLNRRMHEIL